MAYKDFTAARREVEREPVEFGLGGETFACVPILPPGPIMDLTEAPEGTVAQQMGALRRFLHAALLNDAEIARFELLLARKVDPPTFDDLMALVAWLAEVYTGRPTQPSSPSAPSSPSDGRNSNSDTESGSS